MLRLVEKRIGSLVVASAIVVVTNTCASVSVAADPPENWQPNVQYVGSDKCVECHRDEHRSYLQTTHSVATEKTNVQNEPDPASFRHEYSGHTYEVDHQGDALIHREIMCGSSGEPRTKTEHKIAYTIGSGAHGKSYLYRDGEFWAQSPLSWFRDSETWGMSPGYDRPFHLSFRRKVRSGCVFCHVGSIDRLEGNPFCFEIVEERIGCERCHGPGELHVEKHRNGPAVDEIVGAQGDPTIVNPEKLSRELSEAICQQCHLQAMTNVVTTGKSPWDFRPGMPITDIRVDYQYRLGDETMKIVGHVEQMHMSECYQQTETLTCITCHDPHHTPAPEDVVDHYRSICLSCHQDDSCGKPHVERMELANNDCATCHMPKAETNVAHAAFRQHRIGIHDGADAGARKVIAGLTPVVDVSNLSTQEQQRCASLAKFKAYRAAPADPNFSDFGIEAAKSLIELKQTSKNDPDVNAALAQLAQLQQRPDIAKALSEEVLRLEPAPTDSRIAATGILAQAAFRRRDLPQALAFYRALASYNRDAHDTYFLGLCENNAGNIEAAISSLQRSLEIDPTQEAAHVALQAIHQSRGNQEESQYHAREAAANRELNQRLQEKLQELQSRSKKP